MIYYNPLLYVPLPFGSIACNTVLLGGAEIPVDGVAADDGAGLEEVRPPEPAPAEIRAGDRFVAAAETAFREGRYQDAVTEVHHALVEDPNDGYVMLLLSQALFAVGDYQGAITTVYRGMSQLDTDQWGFVVQNYAQYYGDDDYVAQMQKLNEYIKSHPDAAYAYALRGYHFGYLGYDKQARDDLGRAMKLEPRDQFAARLYAIFGGKPQPVPPQVKPPANQELAPADGGASP